MKQLQQLLTEAIARGDANVKIRRYSGRGMMGDECVAITGSINQCHMLLGNALSAHIAELFTDVIDSDLDDDDVYKQVHAKQDALEALTRQIFMHQQDSMGRDVVIYWSQVEWIEPNDDLDEADTELSPLI